MYTVCGQPQPHHARPNSAVSRLVKLHGGQGLRAELGTKPRVIYIRDYRPTRRVAPARPENKG
jgi:hypothetical protein